MKHYVFRLLPPRASFLSDMTADEGALMQQHALYLSGLMEKGHVIAFGPVADPAGPWGLGLFALDDGIDPETVSAADPVILAGAGFRYEILPMLQLVTK